MSASTGPRIAVRARVPAQCVGLAMRMIGAHPTALLPAWFVAGALNTVLGLLLYLRLEVEPLFALVGVTLLGAVHSGPLVLVAGRLVFEAAPTRRRLVSALARALPGYLWTFLLGRVATLIALPLALPAFWIFRGTLFLAPITLLEGGSRLATLKRSFGLARGYERRLLAQLAHVFALTVYLALAILASLTLVVNAGYGIAGGLELLDLAIDHFVILAIVSLAFALPMASLAWFFAYLDLRTRKEGWDLELAIRSLIR